MTVGLAAQKLALKKRNAKIAAAFPNGVRCQKCLQFGHWSYECKEKRKFVHRSSRTKQLSKHIAAKKEKADAASSSKKEPKSKRQKQDDSSDSSSTSDSESSSSDSSSDSDSSSSSGSESDSSDSESDSSSSSSSLD